MTDGLAFLTGRDELRDLAGAWDALAPSPFLRSGWLDAWWGAFAREERVRLAVWQEGGTLRAALPLLEARGGWVAAANPHSVETGPLGDAASVGRLLAAVVGEAGQVDLAPVAGPPPRGGGGGCIVERTAWGAAPWVTTTGGYDAWRAASKPRWGAPLERFERKMAREHDRTVDLLAPLDVATFEEGLALEAAGWKGRGGTAVLSDEATTAFYRALAANPATASTLRLNALRLDGRLVAWDLCVLHDRRLHLLKTAFDEGTRRLAPGLVLRLQVVRACFADPDVDLHDLQADATPWKLKFATGVRPLSRWRCYARRPVPFARYASRRSARALRRALAAPAR